MKSGGGKFEVSQIKFNQKKKHSKIASPGGGGWPIFRLHSFTELSPHSFHHLGRGAKTLLPPEIFRSKLIIHPERGWNVSSPPTNYIYISMNSASFHAKRSAVSESLILKGILGSFWRPFSARRVEAFRYCLASISERRPRLSRVFCYILYNFADTYFKCFIESEVKSSAEGRWFPISNVSNTSAAILYYKRAWRGWWV